MSFDARLLHLCPHMLNDLPASLADDGVTVVPSIVTGGSKFIQVKVDGITVPSKGIKSPLVVTSIRQEPYTIIVGNNTLIFKMDNTEQKLFLPVGQLTNNRIMQLVNNNSNLKVKAEVVNGYLTFSSSDFQIQTFSVHGSATSALGFTDQIGAVRFFTYPAWDLVADYEANESYPFNKIVFRSPINTESVIHLTFTTEPSWCTRCQGSLVEWDFRVGMGQEVNFTTDFNLFLQVLIKFLITRRGSNIHAPWYGTTIPTLYGKKNLVTLKQEITQEINYAISTIANLQNSQAQYQNVSNAERIGNVSGINITKDEEDPTMVFIEFTVTAPSNTGKVHLIVSSSGTTGIPNNLPSLVKLA